MLVQLYIQIIFIDFEKYISQTNILEYFSVLKKFQIKLKI